MPTCLLSHSVVLPSLSTWGRLVLTYHHEARLIIERGPVGVDQSLLQLLDGDVATVIRVH